MRENALTEQVIGAAMHVHTALGPGLLESIYETCLARELSLTGIPFERQRVVSIEYKGAVLEADLRLDFLIDRAVVVEVKAVERVLPVHEAQLLTYLRLARCRVGLLLNFNVPSLRDGIHRKIIDL